MPSWAVGVTQKVLLARAFISPDGAVGVVGGVALLGHFGKHAQFGEQPTPGWMQRLPDVGGNRALPVEKDDRSGGCQLQCGGASRRAGTCRFVFRYD